MGGMEFEWDDCPPFKTATVLHLDMDAFRDCSGSVFGRPKLRNPPRRNSEFIPLPKWRKSPAPLRVLRLMSVLVTREVPYSLVWKNPRHGLPGALFREHERSQA